MPKIQVKTLIGLLVLPILIGLDFLVFAFSPGACITCGDKLSQYYRTTAMSGQVLSAFLASLTIHKVG